MRLPKHTKLPQLSAYVPKTKDAHVKTLMKQFEVVKNFVETKSVIGPPKILFDKLYIKCAKLLEKFDGEVKPTGDINKRSPKRSARTDPQPNPRETHTERGQQPEGHNGSVVPQLVSARESSQSREVSSPPSIVRKGYWSSRRGWSGLHRTT
ncbi:hypothetical protein BDR22DRAFT_176990 [Usnea florida]